MKYLFRDKWHDVQPYTSYPGCALVSVEYTIPLAHLPPTDQRVMETRLRKLRAFIAAEGLSSTVRKVRSKRTQAALNGDFHLIVAVGRRLGDPDKLPVLCLGTRHPRCANVMLFREELIAPLPVLPLPELCAQALQELAPMPGAEVGGWSVMGGYNFYSDMAPPADCVNFVQALASALARTQAPSNASKRPGGQAGDHNAIYPPSAELSVPPTKKTQTAPGVVVIAAGDYARTQIIPALKRSGIHLQTVVDLEPYFAEYARRKFDFSRSSTDWREALSDPDAEIAIISTYHDSHARIGAEALQRGKKVLLEKPPAVTREDLSLLLDAAKEEKAFLQVGFNRRFAAFTRKATDLLREADGPTTMYCVVKEVDIPDSHWYRWPKEGTRITGNICHWIDLAVCFLGAANEPVEMTLFGRAEAYPDEERGLNIVFRDGSTVTIITTTRGDSTLGVQEFIELRRADLTIRIDDYRYMHAERTGRTLFRQSSLRDKGHAAMYKETLEHMLRNEPASYTLEDLRISTLLTINATEMVQKNLRHSKLALTSDQVESFAFTK
ncbi:MAG: Gfo/Idh/MocA family oxidoreductase [Acidobacteriota bacterium]|nr:Gfo/Idh/MocA family oxidoreductase [Acidobacteriota bacterium]